METVIIILLISLASIPVILNLPHIKDKFLAGLRRLKGSSGKKINSALEELSYFYNNTSVKKNRFRFNIESINSSEIKADIHNKELLYFNFKLPRDIPFTIIKFSDKAAQYKRKIEKKYKVSLKKTISFNDFRCITNVEPENYIFLLPEKLQLVLKNLASNTELTYISGSSIILAFIPDMDIHNLIFFKKFIKNVKVFNSLITDKQDLINIILNNINTSSNPEIRKINLEAFYDICIDDEKIKEVLLKALKDKYWQPAITAAKLLGDEGHEYLVNFLKHPVNFVKIEAINSLKYLNNRSCRIILNLLLYEDHTDLKTAIFKMLTRLGDTGNFREIFNYLENYTNYVALDTDYYLSVIEYLKMCRQLSAVVILSRMKNFSNRTVRKAAARAINTLKREHDNDTDGWLSMPDSGRDSGSLSLHKVPGEN